MWPEGMEVVTLPTSFSLPLSQNPDMFCWLELKKKIYITHCSSVSTKVHGQRTQASVCKHWGILARLFFLWFPRHFRNYYYYYFTSYISIKTCRMLCCGFWENSGKLCMHRNWEILKIFYWKNKWKNPVLFSEFFNLDICHHRNIIQSWNGS